MSALNVKYTSIFLADILNLSVRFGIIPSHWKTSIPISIHSKDTLLDLTSYRLTNRTPIFTGTIQQLSEQQRKTYHVDEKLVNTCQGVFLKKKSCAVCDCLNTMATAIKAGRFLIVAYLDMAKALVRASHLMLSGSIKSCGITNPMLQWIKSYHLPRNQVTQVNDYSTHPTSITGGVIQSNAPGRLLCLLYANNFSTTFQKRYFFLIHQRHHNRSHFLSWGSELVYHQNYPVPKASQLSGRRTDDEALHRKRLLFCYKCTLRMRRPNAGGHTIPLSIWFVICA